MSASDHGEAGGFISLQADQLEEFYHDEFVKDQVHDFQKLVPDFASLSDLGGGVGYFARAISDIYQKPVQVIDLDPESVSRALQSGLGAVMDNVLMTRSADASDVVSFNLVLHHLVGPSLSKTYDLQKLALSNQMLENIGGRRIFVNEYVYESYIFDEFASAFIFTITSSSILSFIGSFVSKFVPSLRANTFGVGVRFHSHDRWVQLFKDSGWAVTEYARGKPEFISAPRRLAFLLKSCRRDSFVLSPLN